MSVGLDLDERVVRRHVSKLEAAGWLGRMPWIWGEGSVAWLTSAGTEAVGLGGLRSIKAPPSHTLADHAVFVGWSAARLERRGRMWKSARELTVDSERWAVRTRCERGYTTVMPDLVGWVQGEPIAVIAESGFRREDRQKWILEGWRDAISNGLYAGVRYDCTSESVANWINRLARKAWLTGPTFTAKVQPAADEIAALPRTDSADDQRPAAEEPAAPDTERPSEPDRPPPVRVEVPPLVPPAPQVARVHRSAPPPETPEQAAERQRFINELLGHEEPKPRRRWRR